MIPTQISIQYTVESDPARVTLLCDPGMTFQGLVAKMWGMEQSWGHDRLAGCYTGMALVCNKSPRLWLVEGGQAFALEDWGGMELRDGDLIVDMKHSPEKPPI